MDETSGGTMTPPRDQDATNGEVAQVIRLRRHPHETDTAEPTGVSEPDSRGIWDHDAPPANLAERPSVWEQPTATELLMPEHAAAVDTRATGDEATIVIPPRGARFARVTPRRLAQSTGLAAVLATAAVAVTLAVGERHPRTPRAATSVTRHSTPKHSVTDTAATKTTQRAHARRPAAKAGARSRRHSSTQHVRHATVTVGAHRSPTAVIPASAATQTQTQTSSVQSIQAPVRSTPPAQDTGASSCVPGELGC